MDRAAWVARWLVLTREVLPGMAKAQAWPIHADHCFMRVCLDHAAGGRWDRVVRRPAIRHMDDTMLRAAVAMAEQIVAAPHLLPSLNAGSLAWRHHPTAASGPER